MRIQIQPDHQKANALRKMAAITLERLKETNELTYPSNTLTDYYDILHKLLEALLLEKGFKFKGDGAHQQLIDSAAEEFFDEATRTFLQQLREYRNRIAYEGFIVQEEYLHRNSARILELIRLLHE